VREQARQGRPSARASTVIEASAPVRICDNGGWTDTWFGGPGRVLNIAVTPGVHVAMVETTGPDPVVVDVTNFGHRYALVPGEARVARYPLIEAAIDAFPPPSHLRVRISVRSPVPPGSGAGTSAGVAVALLGALFAARDEQPSRRQVAYAAHRLEVEALAAESGIQDQLSAAFGGINYLEIEPYPEATVQALPPWDALGPRLSLIFLGRAHDSSGVHRQVIDNVGGRRVETFDRLRAAAIASRDAVLAKDLLAFGRAMTANTEAQASLHPELVGADARRVIRLASAQRAIGWKVNGAGGDGGSITVLSRTPAEKTAFERLVTASEPRYRILPIDICPVGLRIRGTLPRRVAPRP
jgi:D-glycero-alpha-D-manno-heptose-7-phosphate kinase